MVQRLSTRFKLDNFLTTTNISSSLPTSIITTDNISTSLPTTVVTSSTVDPSFTGTAIEDIYVILDTLHVLSPSRGSIQTHTLSGNTTYMSAFFSGQAITLMIYNPASYTISWPTMTWVNNGGAAPTLTSLKNTVVSLWYVGSTLYGALVGNGT